MRRTVPLTQREVDALDQGTHNVGGVTGLYLQVRGESRTWLLRYQIPGGPPRSMGLGSTQDVPLKLARERAGEHRKLIAARIDPIEQRDRKAAEDRGSKTFGDLAADYISNNRRSWKSDVHARQWQQTLDDYVLPTLGKMDVRLITINDIVRVLKPLWQTKIETGKRVRGRMEAILQSSIALGLRPDNPAILPTVKAILGKQKRVVEHHAAIPHERMHELVGQLRDHPCASAYALEFLVLTAARVGEVLQFKVSQVRDGVWHVPADAMKAGRAHTVPLSKRAREIVKILKDEKCEGFGIQDGAMQRIQQRLGFAEFTVHGHRASFRSWAEEQGKYPAPVIEMALAHSQPALIAAYQRSDLLALRSGMMEEWSKFARPMV